MINAKIIRVALLIYAILNISLFVAHQHEVSGTISLIIGIACVIAYESS